MKQRLGLAAWWALWPAYIVYFRLGERGRVLLVSGDEVLLVYSRFGNGRWNVPGGGLHRGEDPAVGAAREVREETGIVLEPQKFTPLGRQIYRGAGIMYRYHAFAMRISRDVQLTRQPREIADIRWFKTTDLTPQVASKEVFDCIAAARTAGLLQ